MPPGVVHVPPALGVPPNNGNNPWGTPLEHAASVPSEPALGDGFTFTVTIELTITQGAGAAMLYV